MREGGYSGTRRGRRGASPLLIATTTARGSGGAVALLLLVAVLCALTGARAQQPPAWSRGGARPRGPGLAPVPDGETEAPRLAPGERDEEASEADLVAALRRGQPQSVLVTFKVADDGSSSSSSGGGGGGSSAAAVRGGRGGGNGREARLEAFAAAKAAVLGSDAAASAGADRGGGSSDKARGGPRLKRDYKQLPIALVTVHSEAELAALRANPAVAAVDADAILYAKLTHSLPLMRLPQALAAGASGAGCNIAVMDSGINWANPAFNCTGVNAPQGACRVLASVNIAADDGGLDTLGHGTFVAGIAAGAAPGSNLVALDVFDANAQAPASVLVAALDWILANKDAYSICAVSMALGGRVKRTKFCDELPDAVALAELRKAGVLAAVSSGNEGYKSALVRPSCASAAVSVGALYTKDWGAEYYDVCTDSSSAADVVPCYSNSVGFLTMLAPGHLITAAGASEGGTSAAAPHVAGAISVLKAAVPAATPDQIVAALVAGGYPVKDRKGGRVKPALDVEASLSLLRGGASIRVDGRAPGVTGGTVLAAVTTLAALPSGATVCLSDTSSDPAACCATAPLATNGGSVAYALASPGDGDKVLYAFVRSGSGCGASLLATGTARFQADVTPPTVTAAFVGGASITRARAQTVSITSSDAGSGVADMCVAVSANARGRMSKCVWGPPQTSASVTLARFRGNHTVSVSARDGAGNIAVSNATIVLDAAAPKMRSPLRGAPLAGTPGGVTLTWKRPAEDDGAGLAGYYLVHGASRPPARCGVDPSAPGGGGGRAGALVVPPGDASATVTGLTPGASYAFRLCAYDRAGNVAPGKAWAGRAS